MKSVKNPTRLKPLPREKLSSEFGDLFKDLPNLSLNKEDSPVNVFGVVVQNPELAKYFIPYWVKSKTLLHLTVREQELIILRMAWLYKCDYVWGHHDPIMRKEMDEKKILQIPLGEKGDWDEKDKALLRATDSLVKKANLTKRDWSRLKKHYNEVQILDIITVVSQYVFFAAVNNTFGVKLETDALPRLPTHAS